MPQPDEGDMEIKDQSQISVDWTGIPAVCSTLHCVLYVSYQLQLQQCKTLRLE